jgi:hypothetical protein
MSLFNRADKWYTPIRNILCICIKYIVIKIRTITQKLVNIYTKYHNSINFINSFYIELLSIASIENIENIEITNSLAELNDAIIPPYTNQEYCNQQNELIQYMLISAEAVSISASTSIDSRIINIIDKLSLYTNNYKYNLNTITLNNARIKALNIVNSDTIIEPTSLQDFNNYINILISNLNYIKNTYILNHFIDIGIPDVTDMFYSNQEKLNKLINLYNSKLKKYYNNTNNYNIILVIGICLLIIMCYIYNTEYILTIIKIRIFIILVIILVIVIYYNNIHKETFMTIINYENQEGIRKKFDTDISLELYREAQINYIITLTRHITNKKIDYSIKPVINYRNKMIILKNEKIKYYKLKYNDLINSIEIIKKAKNNYKYFVLLYYYCIVTILICIICNLLEIPAKIIVIFFIMTIIILIYNFSYKIHRITRMNNDKFYWSNFNPFFI